MFARTRTAAPLALLLACTVFGQTRADTPTPAKPVGATIFPARVNHKYAGETAGKARLHTCLDQYHANKASNANGDLKWIQTGGGYYSLCLKKLKR